MVVDLAEQALAERLKVIRADKGLSQKEMGAVMGVSQTTYGSYEIGRTSPSAISIWRLAEIGYNPTWLVTGEEPMKLEGHGQQQPQGDVVRTVFRPASRAVVPPEFTLIPRVDVQAAAGSGAMSEREDVAEMLAFRRDWLHRMGVSAVDARVITVRGDSMYPILQNGDIILIDAGADGWLDDGGIYVIRVDNRLLVKRIATKVGGALLLISENPVYPPEEVSSAADLDIIGQVKWYGRALS